MINFSQVDINPRISKSSNPKIGVIALSTDFTIEQDFRRLCHNQNVDIYVNRIPFENPLNKENYLKMAEHLADIASNILPGEHIDSIAYGCTSGTVAIGEKKIVNEINKSKKGTYVSTPLKAALKAFTNLKFGKIAVLTPYPEKVNKTIYDYLIKNNIEITSFNSFNLEYDNDIANVDPKCLIETIDKIDHKDADAVFISCTALRAVEVLDKIEKIISKYVISSNQAIIWDCLRSVNINNNISGYGKLFFH
jgi:maleate isomerase